MWTAVLVVFFTSMSYTLTIEKAGIPGETECLREIGIMKLKVLEGGVPVVGKKAECRPDPEPVASSPPEVRPKKPPRKPRKRRSRRR